MKLKISKVEGSGTVFVAKGSGRSEFLEEPIILDTDKFIGTQKSITICDNPLNICRCIVKIEEVV